MLDRIIGAPMKVGQKTTVRVVAIECPSWSTCQGNCPIQVKARDRKCLVWDLKASSK